MPPVFSDENLKRLPAPIVERLEGIIARIRRVVWLRGLWLTVAAAVAAILVVMAVDAAFDIESIAVRCLLSFSALLLTVCVALRFLVRPLSRSLNLTTVARLVEIHHPEMQERISTAVELLATDDPAGLRGSEELLEQVVKSAIADVGAITPEAEFSAAPAQWPKRAALTVVSLLLVTLAIWPFHTGLLLIRALAPFADIGNASSFALRVITQDVTVAESDPLTLLVAARGKAAKRIAVHQKSDAGIESVERMTPEQSSQIESNESGYALRIPAAKESFSYHVTAGRARTREFRVHVLRRPAVTGLAVSYLPPAYTGLPPRTDLESSGDILALAGTQIELTASLEPAATSATIQYDQTENWGPPVTLAEESGKPVARWAVTLEPGTNWRWRLLLKGEKEIDGRPREGALRSTDDLPPSLVIDSPVDRELTLRPNEVLPIIYTAADDFGFSGIALKISLDGRGETLIAAPPPEKDAALPQTWLGQAALDISKLPLDGVTTLRVRVRAADNLPADLGGPQMAVSDEIVIQLSRGAPSYAEQAVARQEQLLRRELDQIRNDLRDERNKAEQKMWQMRNREAMKPEQLQQLEKLTRKTTQTADQLQQLADKMKHSAFAERSDALEMAAQEMVRPAAAALQQIPQSDSPQNRAEAAEQARDQLDEAIKVAEKTFDSLWQDEHQGHQAARLASLAQQEQQLADAAKDAIQPQTAVAQGPTEDRPSSAEEQARAAGKALDRWQEQQQQVASQAHDLAQQWKEQNPAGQPNDLQTLTGRAQQLARQAEDLAQQQNGVQQQTATSPAHAVEQARAAQKQADVAAEARQLSEAVQQFQQQAGPALSQNGEALQGTMDATRELQSGAEAGIEAARELAKAASQSAENIHPEAGVEPMTAAASDTKDTGDAEPVGVVEKPAAPASQSLTQTGEALDSATEALQTTVKAFLEHAQEIGTGTQALGEAVQQTRQAAEAGQQAKEAGRQAGEQAGGQAAANGQNPQLAAQQAANQAASQALASNAAVPAQHAADNLALAAARAAQAFGVPPDALTSQNMGQHGKPVPGSGPPGQNQASQNQPANQPGNASDKQGLQTTKGFDLPPELARLGVSVDDWTRLRGLVRSGSDAAAGDSVPSEYRDLVRGYFRALATGAATGQGR